MDFPKFADMLTSGKIWLTNAEVLAADDPHEGLQGAVQFPHRIWRSIADVPEFLRTQILEKSRGKSDTSDEQTFKGWFMAEEQRCYMTQSGRRNFYVNCWHMAEHESAAMWKIYGSPGAGVAIVSSAGRLHTALEGVSERLYFGEVKYMHPMNFEIGTPNALDTLVRKRSNFGYEHEARIVYWETGNYHDPLENFEWNEEKMRFENIVEDRRPITPGLSIDCDVGTLIEHLIVSPYAPKSYLPMIQRMMEKLNFDVTISQSNLLTAPQIVE